MSNQTEFAAWLDRRVGSWTSERRYLFNMETLKPTSLTTEFIVDKVGALRWQVAWKGQTEGLMELNLEGDLLHRSRDYFGPGSHSSRLSLIDKDTLLLNTSYDGLSYREEIRYVKNDYVLRQTIGFSDTTGRPALVGQYMELRTDS